MLKIQIRMSLEYCCVPRSHFCARSPSDTPEGSLIRCEPSGQNGYWVLRRSISDICTGGTSYRSTERMHTLYGRGLFRVPAGGWESASRRLAVGQPRRCPSVLSAHQRKNHLQLAQIAVIETKLVSCCACNLRRWSVNLHEDPKARAVMCTRLLHYDLRARIHSQRSVQSCKDRARAHLNTIILRRARGKADSTSR